MHKWMMAAALLHVAVALPARAQTDFDKVEITSETLAPGLHVLFGAGGNIGVSTGADATALIDDQYAPLTARIVAATAKLSPHPIKFVINTHWHGDHTGGNENLGKAGAVIIAHDNVRTRMASDQFMAAMQRTVKASPPAALPVVTFDSTTTVHLNGEDIRAVHIAPAHTDGDSLIVFTKANVIHMGDTFMTTSYPYADLSSGGNVRGYLAAHDTALALGNATTRYIPGHGKVSDRAGLVAYRTMVAETIAAVEAAMAGGKSVEAVVAAKPTAPWDARWGQAFIKPDAWVRTIYASLSAKAH
jgi:glyoxylase-like metal-dependent hydrolase (beta-lactamase superfamily II)